MSGPEILATVTPQCDPDHIQAGSSDLDLTGILVGFEGDRE